MDTTDAKCSNVSYAPFCKHLFIENFTGARLNIVPITQANASMLMSDYEARTEYELTVYVLSSNERRGRMLLLSKKLFF